jgi:hypothetical protein
MGGLEFDVVLTAAAWAFSRQDETIRGSIVADFWLRELSELEASGVERSRKTFKEKVHALAAYCYAAFRRRLAA